MKVQSNFFYLLFLSTSKDYRERSQLDTQSFYNMNGKVQSISHTIKNKTKQKKKAIN